MPTIFNYQQISNMLNTSIVPAIMGGDYTVNPDLSNIVDFGTAFDALKPEQVKSYLGDLITGVYKTIVDNRIYSPEKLPLYVSDKEYGGIMQSVKMEMYDTYDSDIYTLENGKIYGDVNKYFGDTLLNKVFTKATGFSIRKSVPREMYKKAFTTPADTAALIGYIERNINSTINRANSALEHNLLAAVGKYGKEIALVTKYNAMVNGVSPKDPIFAAVTTATITGTDGANDVSLTKAGGKPAAVTAENCIYNPHFMKWAVMTIRNVIANMPFLNKKYNDGTVSTWLAPEDRTAVFNSLWLNAASVYEAPDMGIPVISTPFWNAQPDSPIPDLAGSTVCIDKIISEQGDNNRNFVIGVVFDRTTCGYTDTPIPTDVAYNEAGKFYTYFIDSNRSYWFDTRNTAVAFTLN